MRLIYFLLFALSIGGLWALVALGCWLQQRPWRRVNRRTHRLSRRDHAMNDEQIAELLRDKARLDWLDSQSDGSSCIARQSVTGRGFRLHNQGFDDSENPLCRSTFRGAIDAGMEAEKERGVR